MKSDALTLALAQRPTARQRSWQDREFTGLIAFSLATFTGESVCDGTADATMFYPVDCDPTLWAQICRDAGMQGVLLTAKHYDGFCTWRTETTRYGVAHTNWLDGGGDVMRDTASAVRAAGLPFGIYYPIWDRHERSYGQTGGAYNRFVLTQIEELTTRYGSLFEFMLDDRCEEAPAEPIDYGAIYRLIRRNQPGCAITFRGPDARFVGNDRGVTRASEFSTVPAAYSFDEDGSVPVSRNAPKPGKWDLDIASAKAIKKETAFRWAPCETIVPMRPHWFYSKNDNSAAKTKDKLLDFYNRTAGNNGSLCLVLSPDKNGGFTDMEMQILRATGHDLQILYAYNLCKDAEITASSGKGKTANLLTDNDTFWSPEEKDRERAVTVRFEKPEIFDRVVLRENLAGGERVESFRVFVDAKGKWKLFYKGGAVGHKKICCGKGAVESNGVKIVFDECRAAPQIAFLQIN